MHVQRSTRGKTMVGPSSDQLFPETKLGYRVDKRENRYQETGRNTHVESRGHAI
jgi:hypothetical protein